MCALCVGASAVSCVCRVCTCGSVHVSMCVFVCVYVCEAHICESMDVSSGRNIPLIEDDNPTTPFLGVWSEVVGYLSTEFG